MKNIRYAISILFLVLVISIVGNLIISTLALFFNEHVLHLEHSEPSIFTQIVFAFKAIALVIFIYGVFTLITKLKLFTTGNFFHADLIKCYLKAGKLFFISGILGFVISICAWFLYKLIDFNNQIYLNLDSKGLYILLMILGLFFILFAKILIRGNELQQENDLTI